MSKYMEYKEFRIPDEIISKLEAGATNSQPMTLGDAGVFNWLSDLSKSQGWRVVWQALNFPFVILEREVEKN
jgi:hypothetical protein